MILAAHLICHAGQGRTPGSEVPVPVGFLRRRQGPEQTKGVSAYLSPCTCQSGHTSAPLLSIHRMLLTHHSPSFKTELVALEGMPTSLHYEAWFVRFASSPLTSPQVTVIWVMEVLCTGVLWVCVRVWLALKSLGYVLFLFLWVRIPNFCFEKAAWTCLIKIWYYQ